MLFVLFLIILVIASLSGACIGLYVLSLDQDKFS